MLIEDLEKFLLDEFPAETACVWDKTGLLVGNREAEVRGVACALDPTVPAVREAAKLGCNVLLTHHPALLDGMFSHGVDGFYPAESVADNNGALVYAAIEAGVALINVHTALDVSESGAALLPSMLGLHVERVAFPTDGTPLARAAEAKLGFGRICNIVYREKFDPKAQQYKTDSAHIENPPEENSVENMQRITLQDLANRCKTVFGRTPRCWGQPSDEITLVTTTTGSTGGLNAEDGLLLACIDAQVDALVCGEIRYHDALVMRDAGVAIVELGHDVSELPFANFLAGRAQRAGVTEDKIHIIDQNNNWF